MPKGYVIFKETIHDPEAMKAYSEAAAKAIGGGPRVLAVDRHPQVVEGEWSATQTVVLEFESVEAARAWYESDVYQAAVPLRQAAADSDVVIINGFWTRPARPPRTRRSPPARQPQRLAGDDAWIAAMARSLGVPVVTQDDELPDITGLDLIKVSTSRRRLSRQAVSGRRRRWPPPVHPSGRG